jgi:Holliday junction resolvase-like predicted endonuclease
MTKFSEKRRFGNLGEDIAEMFLVKQGYRIVECNYLKKWGELDIVSEHNRILHFIEVKTVSAQRVSHETSKNSVSRFVSQISFTPKDFSLDISHETPDTDEYLPEDNVNYWKQKRMIRAIQTYLIERNTDEDQEWQIDVITVKIDFSRKTAIIKHIENVVFDI